MLPEGNYIDHDYLEGGSQYVSMGDDTFDAFDASVEDIDFSEIRGKSFKKNFSKVKHKVNTKSASKNKGKQSKPKPLSKEFFVRKRANIVSPDERKLSKVIVPRDRKVIVEGVSSFILSQKPQDEAFKNIGYYKGKRLKELVLIVNNTGPNDFDFSLFNPSMPLDYLYSTSLNLNDKITVNGGAISYTDVLHNILANPVAVRNAKFVLLGSRQAEQQNISLKIQNKSTTGVSEVTPLQMSLQVDVMQVEGYVISFDVEGVLNRPFIADGMDVINYKVLAGNSVVMCFYYEQKKIKKFFFPEALDEPKMMLS